VREQNDGMVRSRRAKLWFFLGTGGSILLFSLWAGYLVCAMWLRVRCVRELAAMAEQVQVVDEPIRIAVQDWNNTGQFLWSLAALDLQNQSRIPNIVERLATLQKPAPRTIFQHLLRLSGSKANQESSVVSVTFSSKVHTIILSDPSSSVSQNVFVELAPPSVMTGDTPNPHATVSGEVSAIHPVQGRIVQLAVAPSNSSLQILSSIAGQWRCFSLRDTQGIPIWLVIKPGTAPFTDSALEPDTVRPTDELLLIDSGGTIFARLPGQEGFLLGRLAEPLGKADQLVFGPKYPVVDMNTGQLPTTNRWSVYVIEHGKLKFVRDLATVPVNPDQASPAESDP
jgi:hypothetical protein